MQLAVALALVAGCAGSDPVPARPELDMSELRQLMNCASDQAPVCTERMGQPYHCFCADRDALRRIMEPDKY